MINDFNYMMFHQHLFGDLNEFELAKRDQWFNSPGLDLLFQDYCGVVGLNPYHSIALNSAIQHVLIFPLVLMLDLLLFSNSEVWVSFAKSGFDDLTTYCDWRVLLVIIILSLLTLTRPVVQFYGMTKLSISQILNTQVAAFYIFMIIGQVISIGYTWIQITQLIGFTITVFAHRNFIQCVEKDMKDRNAAQIVCMLKAKFEPTRRMQAQKLENQLTLIYDTNGEALFH